MLLRAIIISILLTSSVCGLFLADEENILLIPSIGFRTNSTHWSISTQGWYYEKDRTQALIFEKLIESIIKRDLVNERIVLITADGLKERNVCVEGFSKRFCRNTNEQGKIEINFQITDTQITESKPDSGSSKKIIYQAIDERRNEKSQGEIFLLENDGLTVISDIDDTIKITGVSSTTETLINTFGNDFKAVPSMSNAYRLWQNENNATFAYVTGSPDQLYPFLRSFMDRENFPQGSAHMRHFTWLDENFISFFISSTIVPFKTGVITKLINSTVNRKYVLVGDIFQKDPEIYADIYSKFPSRISQIFIRKLGQNIQDQQRLENVFINVPREKWATFENGTDLPSTLNTN